MNETWKRIFKEYVACYDAIDTLVDNDIVEDSGEGLRNKLLDEIIETMRTEIKD